MKKIIIFLWLLSFVFYVAAQNISSNQHRLINNWQFLRQDLGGIWEAVRFSKPGDPTSVPIWENVNLPHCFNSEDAVDPDVNYYQGPGWYRTSLNINNPYPNGRTLLHFEGAGQKTQVYVGMQLAGEHVGGYDEWTVDITDFIDAAKKDSAIQSLYKGIIPVSIRCDNSRDLQMIPSDLSDFTIYGGLYRYVNLIYVPETYLQQVHIQAIPDENLKSGKLQIKGNLQNVTGKSALALIRVSSPEGKLVSEQEIEISQNHLSIEIPVTDIQLWSPTKPALYTVLCSICVIAWVFWFGKKFHGAVEAWVMNSTKRKRAGC